MVYQGRWCTQHHLESFSRDQISFKKTCFNPVSREKSMACVWRWSDYMIVVVCSGLRLYESRKSLLNHAVSEPAPTDERSWGPDSDPIYIWYKSAAPPLKSFELHQCKTSKSEIRITPFILLPIILLSIPTERPGFPFSLKYILIRNLFSFLL